MASKFSPFGRRVVGIKSLAIGAAATAPQVVSGSGIPKSGPAGTEVSTPFGSVYIDITTGALFTNEGSAGAPYWSPVSIQQRGLLAWLHDFRDGAGKALADTAATATLDGSGLRIHGDSVADTDSGMTVTMSSDGPVGNLQTGNESADCTALSFGTGTTAIVKPSVNGTVVLDARVAQSAALTNRSMFIGFCNSAADALPSPVTGATATISFAGTHGDDVVGFFRSTGLTSSARWFAPHDKANTNASIATTATGVDTGVDQAAAGTYQRFRVEIDADGAVRMFIDKVQVTSFAAGTMTPATALQPVLLLSTLTTANAVALVKHFTVWGVRP